MEINFEISGATPVAMNAQGAGEESQVLSVNGQTGRVVLDYEDVGALPTGYHDSTKADVSTTYTKTEVDTAIAGHHDTSKADKSDTYTKAEVDSAISNHHDSTKADASNTYTKSEVDSAIASHHDSSKQDTINDLSAIRSGASAGATAVQPSAISDMATKTWTNSQGFLKEHQSLSAYRTSANQDVIDNGKQATLVSGTNIKTINNQNILGSGNIEVGGAVNSVNGQTGTVVLDAEDVGALPDFTVIPTKTSDLTNDSGFLTEHQSLANYDTKEQVNTKIVTATNDMATQTWVGQQGYLTEHQSLSGYATETWVENKGYLTEHQSLSAYRTSANQDIIDNAIESDIDAIEDKIPTQATSSNQLADKDFVNSSIATETAHYISDNGNPFTSVESLPTEGVTNNDYAFVTGTDTEGNTYYDRYKATVSGSTVTWAKEFRLNNSSFTSNQWLTINSGLTSTDKTKLDGISAGAEVNVQSDWNETDTTSDAYINNKPTIPVVPTNVSAFTNDAGYTVKPDLGTINLSATWTGSVSPYTQTVTVSGATVTINSKVDIQPSDTVIAQLISDGCNALYISNNNGTLTAHAVGAKPSIAISNIQVCITEVNNE